MQPAFASRTRERATALAFFEEEAQHQRLLGAHAASRKLGPLRAPWDKTSPAGGLSPSVQDCVAKCQPRPPLCAAGFRVAHTRARGCARFLSEGGAVPAFARRTRRAAQVGFAPRPNKGHWTGERPFSFGVRPWCDVPAEASTLRSRLSRRAHASAQRLRLPRARAVPRRLGSLYVL